jgi:cell volume regulation protein A
MSSTDSASVFSILRSKDIILKENLKSTLELESGSNDPMAYMLTIILIGLIQIGEFSYSKIFIDFFAQMIIGGLIGYVFGRLSVVLINKINIPNKSLYPILLIASAFLIFSASTLLKGNGYLAVYIAGLVIGNYKIIHKKSIITFFDGFTWLFQIIMFIMLGLLVNPKELLDVILIGLAISIFVVIFARPISVFLSLIPFKYFSFKGKLFISWVGLRGAVPIIFATYPLVEGVEHANLFFNIVFFITLVSLLVQGTTITPVAKWLKLIDHTKDEAPIDITLPEEAKSAISEIIVTKDLLTRGNKLINLSLPENTLVIMIKRDTHYFVPTGGSIIKENDKLMIISDNEKALIETYKSLGINDFMLRS